MRFFLGVSRFLVGWFSFWLVGVNGIQRDTGFFGFLGSRCFFLPRAGLFTRAGLLVGWLVGWLVYPVSGCLVYREYQRRLFFLGGGGSILRNPRTHFRLKENEKNNHEFEGLPISTHQFGSC